VASVSPACLPAASFADVPLLLSLSRCQVGPGVSAIGLVLAERAKPCAGPSWHSLACILTNAKQELNQSGKVICC
jgi:hypothetical protein